jgi:hypothetical protein
MSTPATVDKRKCAQSPDKVKYANWARAREIADKRQKIEGRPLFVYACSSCGHWHISKKRGDEHVASIGPGGVIHSSETGRITPPGKRDERFLKTPPNTQKIRDALRSHGNPSTVSPATLRQWTGLSYGVIRRVMTAEGWTEEGKTTKLKWIRPRPVPEVVPSAPLNPVLPDPVNEEVAEVKDEVIYARVDTPQPKVLELDVIGHLTIEQLRLSFLAAGLEIQITVV